MTPRQHFIDYAARRLTGAARTTSTDLSEILECTNVAQWAVLDGVARSVADFHSQIDALNWALLLRAVDRARANQ